MKAATVYQPWASLLAVGAKRYETRSRKVNYRGPIAIHAGKKYLETTLDELFPLLDGYIGDEMKFLSAIRSYLGEDFEDELPYGCVIATAELVECWRIVYHPGLDVNRAKNIPIGGELNVPYHHPHFGDIIVPTNEELLFGDWTPGRYAWELANVKLLPEPIPARTMGMEDRMRFLDRMLICGAIFGIVIFFIITILFETRLDDMSFLLRWFTTYMFVAAGQLFEAIIQKKNGGN